MPKVSATPWQALDWEALRHLRTAFLDGTAGLADYWTSDAALASYDRTFGQRIAWKWCHVLDDLRRLGWAPPAGDVLDWGCGTGVAGREFLEAFPNAGLRPLNLYDRSARAQAFAADLARRAFPALDVRVSRPEPAVTLLLSHVLTELDEPALEGLLALVRHSTAVVWVEPGTHPVSRKLIQIRETLRTRFRVVAPCTHQETCGLLAPANAWHWCHHFARTPTEVFTEGGWTRFGQLAGIDLRSLPLSYLVLDRRPGPSVPDNAVRILGRPRVYKAHALLFGCDRHGVADRELRRRQLPDRFREAKKERLDMLQTWRCEQGLVQAMAPWPGGAARATD